MIKAWLKIMLSGLLTLWSVTSSLMWVAEYNKVLYLQRRLEHSMVTIETLAADLDLCERTWRNHATSADGDKWHKHEPLTPKERRTP